ncbi:hypothetical protein [Heterosigma akashiwo virus 01]|jgi:hypothetical protein|uniref:Uncharacterized protein n=1 Tax=Heterosigma akashiwo virus 01 TaxID=97195 RepID=A0A1C9C570_HAV01|nr:hypothetical protein D1R72_gp102 [Heterosigma akashiwo virus 01]AOM63433.1 hypothetical protein [Heterosigma akashiwo virus 01]
MSNFNKLSSTKLSEAFSQDIVSAQETLVENNDGQEISDNLDLNITDVLASNLPDVPTSSETFSQNKKSFFSSVMTNESETVLFMLLFIIIILLLLNLMKQRDNTHNVFPYLSHFKECINCGTGNNVTSSIKTPSATMTSTDPSSFGIMF